MIRGIIHQMQVACLFDLDWGDMIEMCYETVFYTDTLPICTVFECLGRQ